MVQIPNSLRQICKISLLFIFISAFITVVIGFAIMNVRQEIKILQKYLISAAMVQPNFEKSLILYTSKTENIIKYLLNLRPAGKEDYVGFITKVEKIGEARSLNVEIRSIANDNSGGEKVLSYNISFYGTERDLESFLSDFQGLSFFIKIYELRYINADKLSAGEKETPNINMKIKLYIK